MTDRADLGQIEDLNQRGGRMLSIVDLIQDGTLTIEVAAYLAVSVAQGTSFVTGAVPGGAGKTTLMGALLGLVDRRTRFVTVDSPSVLHGDAVEGRLFIVHEISPASYYGYLWDGHVRGLFRRMSGGERIAATIHEETLKGLRGTLLEAPMNVEE